MAFPTAFIHSFGYLSLDLFLNPPPQSESTGKLCRYFGADPKSTAFNESETPAGLAHDTC